MELFRWLCACAMLGASTAQCSYKSCGECIRASCNWCTDPSLGEGFVNRCFGGAQELKCAPDHVYPKKIADPFNARKNDPFSISTLFQPQSIDLKLNVGEEFDLGVRYRHARNYPVDLYYLMDLSNSMKDDKQKLSKLGNSLALEMRKITTNFQLGFGSFVDKVEMPFVSTVPEKLRRPCEDCVAPYGFKNHLKLDNDTSQFEMKVNEARVSGNLDTPEGGFDALMQAIICQRQIGWRKKARHLLVFSTDAEFHFAGDGRLAGLVEPNDMKCYLSNDGNYTKSTAFDYPSISQINKAAQENNINLIFAVTQNVLDVYKRLTERIKGSSFGRLDADSKNVVFLIKEEYKKIVDSLTLVTTADPEYLKVSLSAKCKDGWQNDTATCGGLLQGDEVTYQARIKVVKCPPTGKMQFQLKPTALEDHVDINLEISCDCECEKSSSPTFEARSTKCKGHGDLRCGACQCDDHRYGDFCQCEKNSLINQNDTTATCRMLKDAPICSDAGDCKCGECTCYKRDDPSEAYSGHFCECDNFTCLRNRDALCSGPEQGTCVCGVCKCRPGWSGEACECPVNKESCYQPGTNEECSGQGTCECGECKCTESGGVPFTGKYCQECPTCQSQQCTIYSNLVDCTVFKSGPLKYTCPEKLDFKIQILDLVEEPEGSDDTIRFCRAQDEDECYFFFRYEVDGASVDVQRTKVCPEQVDILALVLGVVGGIVLLGLLLLAVWKIVTMIHDSREYAKFDRESKSAQFNRTGNPLYQDPVIKYTNPTFRD